MAGDEKDKLEYIDEHPFHLLQRLKTAVNLLEEDRADINIINQKRQEKDEEQDSRILKLEQALLKAEGAVRAVGWLGARAFRWIFWIGFVGLGWAFNHPDKIESLKDLFKPSDK